MKNQLFKLIFIVLLFVSIKGLAQNGNEFSIASGFLQLKEEFNQGMVFDGVQFDFQYKKSWSFSKFEISYQPEVAIGVSFDRKMTAVNFDLSPVNVTFVATVFERNAHELKVGGNFATNYNYQAYPDLHSGHLFWFTEIGLSPQIEYSYKWKNQLVNVLFTNSLLGFVSRPEKNDPYFYSLKFVDFIKFAHQDLKFGSFDKYNHTQISITYIPNISGKHSFALGADYEDVYFGVRFQKLIYYLRWKFSF
ncbi:MAG: hypothetical protein LBP67_06470 [Bacteroidales bacterium]|jgi:hypothetical protein|nr:hypothetical protein [Bacteroidales bacterium]